MPLGGNPSAVLARCEQWVATSSESRRQGGGGDVPRRLARIHSCELESRVSRCDARTESAEESSNRMTRVLPIAQ